MPLMGDYGCIDLDELVRDQPVQQLFEIAPELLAVHVVFRAQRLVRRLDCRPRAQELPGPRPNLIEPEVGLGVEAQDDGLAVELPKQDAVGYFCAR